MRVRTERRLQTAQCSATTQYVRHPVNCASTCRDQRQLDKACLTGRVIDALRCFSVIFRLGPEDVRNKCLRIAIVKWKPTRLNLDHDPVTRQKNVVRGW